MLFSIDTIIASTIILLSLLVFFTALENHTSEISGTGEKIFLEEKTIFVADSFVKNYDPENGLLGACVPDYEKKRVRSNEISSANFLNIKLVEIDKFFVKKISFKNRTTDTTVFSTEKKGKECIVAKRFALIDSEKAVIEIMGCLLE